MSEYDGPARVTYEDVRPFRGFETAKVVKVEVPCECGGTGRVQRYDGMGIQTHRCPVGGRKCDGWRVVEKDAG